ncbi:hypothetical protein EDD76_104101 [Kineothrix alysoides]|uniref:Uncharacterized protein n=1 Tax=Kineothrix alysoides TaxID=1469948 RepID=A0A4R1R1Z0_9FIRM|nr:hypothetical protein EDD76_104101 [Kineothrix alysoides]
MSEVNDINKIKRYDNKIGTKCSDGIREKVVVTISGNFNTNYYRRI